ncbi:MAG: nitroreductase family protein [archaeon]|nr:nitroreductase family protein [archaeon]
MDFSELILKRQSCRAFDPSKVVEQEKIEKCLYAASMAPSAVNAQPYSIWVVKDKAKDIADAKASFNGFTDTCPVFVIFTDRPYGIEKLDACAETMSIDYRTQDIGEAIAYFTLQAEELGLSTCILGSFDKEKVAQVLGTDDHVQTIIALGYAVDGYSVRAKRRRPLSETVTYL